MGKALIKADLFEITDLVQKWAKDNKMMLTKTSLATIDRLPHHFEDHTQLKAKDCLYTAAWQCKPAEDGVELSMTLEPSSSLFLILHTLLFLGLWFTIDAMHNIVYEYTAFNLMKLCTCSILVMLTIWWKDSRLSLRLTWLENSFWDRARVVHDTLQLTRAEGTLYTKGSRLSTELLLLGSLVYIGKVLLGAWGIITSSLLCFPFFSMLVVDCMQRNNPQWHWRLWIVGSMARWTFLMVFTLTTIPVLFALEFTQNLELYKPENRNLSVSQSFKQARFREITPATAKFLEEDAASRIQEFVEYTLSSNHETKEEQASLRNIYLYAYCSGFLLVIVVMILFFIIMPFKRLLVKSYEIWRLEAGKDESLRGPFVPYLPMAWKWEMPLLFHVTVVFHCVFGGVINLLAGVFCFDGLSYALTGWTFLFEKNAYLWSWMFVFGKMLFGKASGQIIGEVLTVAVCLPFLTLLGTYVRRLIQSIFLMIRVQLTRLNWPKCKDSRLSFINAFIKEVCPSKGIKTPEIILIANNSVTIRLHWLALSNQAVIEMSRGAIELLEWEELKSVIAHELGHIKQGLRKIWVLKTLSSLLLFPNHYLTVCVNWSKREIDADQFALSLTKDPLPLKHALIKISTAQLSYLKAAPARQKATRSFSILRIFTGSIKDRWYKMLVSIRFFFGDGLLGYVHPWLSERLEAIDLNATRQ